MSAGQGERGSFKNVVPVRSTLLRMVPHPSIWATQIGLNGKERRLEVGTRWGRGRGRSVGSYIEKWGV